jgi:transcriptional regulator with XRE-family HTH domain
MIGSGLLRRSLKNQSYKGGGMAHLNKADRRIGRRIRLRRIQLGIESKSLAASAKITEARLQAFEAGRESIGAELLAEIAGALGASSAYFFSPLRTGFKPKRQTQMDIHPGAP